MARTGIGAPQCKTVTHRKHPLNQVDPCLLHGVKIMRANPVWATDIRYIPMAQGCVCLYAIVDRANRRIGAHRVSITMVHACNSARAV